MNNTDELRKTLTDVQNTLYILGELSTTPSENLEYVEIDVYYEDDMGNEGACQYDMPAIADVAIKTIIEQADRIAELEVRAKGLGILSGWMISADGKLRKQVGDL